MKINTNIIKRLGPCEERLDNWLLHYKDFSGDLVEFLNLPNISYKDKIWVAVRVMPRFLLEVFAIDCAFNASDAYAAASAATSAATYAYAAAAAANAANAIVTTASCVSIYAAIAAAYAAASADAAAHDIKDSTIAIDKEHKRQVESIISLIKGAK